VRAEKNEPIRNAGFTGWVLWVVGSVADLPHVPLYM